MKNILKTKENISSKKTVYVGMSGGVDSSVTAALLKEAGYDVTGVFIKVWQPDSTDCGWKDERRDAMRVAAVLDIPFLTFDFSEQYKKEVVDYMISEYKAGRTPNPDIMCNRYVKFGSFLDEAKRRGVDFVATGHYAQNVLENGIYSLKEGVDSGKDQSYFLWTLNQNDLKHILFPVGNLQKSEVRKLAEKFKLPVFDKKDSQGVCFIGHLDMKEFLKEYVQVEKGNVLNMKGEVVGEHEGSILFTIGERHGFTIFNKTTVSEPHFVVSKDIKKNTITVAPLSVMIEKIDELAPNVVFLEKVSWVGEKPRDGFVCSARVRYRQEKQDCVIGFEGEKIKVVFDKHQKGVAEGQSVVLMDGNRCIGGGIIFS
jgi:tRNA-specific 2-thiouridylase